MADYGHPIDPMTIPVESGHNYYKELWKLIDRSSERDNEYVNIVVKEIIKLNKKWDKP